VWSVLYHVKDLPNSVFKLSRFFGALILAAELKPKKVMPWFGFMSDLLGRAIFHIFLSTFCVPNV